MPTIYDPFGASKIKNLLAASGLRLSKDRGQNYLVNRQAAEKIVSTLPPLQPGQAYFEVGSGLGALTVLLAEMGSTYSLEIDRGVCSLLAQEFSHPSLQLIHADFLTYPFPPDASYLFISNLPYSISGEALKVFIEQPCFTSGVVMLQKEFAERLLAPAKSPSYGPLSVIAQTFLHIEKLFFIGAGNFFPTPKVDSLVVRLSKKQSPFPQKEFGRFVKTLFLAKRKTLANNISRSPWASSPLAQSPLLGLRPDAVPPEDWQHLFNLKDG